ncbi:MAG TPA: 6-phosphogluconolactonase [Pseudomonadales bacterium]|nr:6-phosphogluconolactonase [Pseudomonadales bacterium]
MRFEVLADADAVAARAASLIAAAARDAVIARGRFVFAVSGGRTPWAMLRLLAREDVPWPRVHVVQVDERVAPANDPDRNLTHLNETLLANAQIDADHIHAMPVEATDLTDAVRRYEAMLRALSGTPPVLDLVHLGLGPDGHTASLVPGDPALRVTDADVTLTEPYQGHRRMTLTYPIIDRARWLLWIVTGADKVAALTKLRAGSRDIPGGRVRSDQAEVLADRQAAP